MLRTKGLSEADEQSDRHPHPSPVAESTAVHQDLRCSGAGREARCPQSGEVLNARALGDQGGEGGGRGEPAQNTNVPGIRQEEELDVSMAPAFGGALEAPGGTHRRDKVRWGSPAR